MPGVVGVTGRAAAVDSVTVNTKGVLPVLPSFWLTLLMLRVGDELKLAFTVQLAVIG